MPNPPNALCASIRIDLEPADADEPPIGPRPEQDLSRAVKPVRPVVPLFNEARYDP